MTGDEAVAVAGAVAVVVAGTVARAGIVAGASAGPVAVAALVAGAVVGAVAGAGAVPVVGAVTEASLWLWPGLWLLGLRLWLLL